MADDHPNTRGLDRLLELQEVDSRVARLRARLETLESQILLRAARADLVDAESRLGALQLEIDQVATQQRRFESDIDSMTRKMEAERKRLFDGTVANPRELQSIEHEVANLRSRIGRIEDELLGAMERREDLEAGLAGAEKVAAEARDRTEEIERSSAQEMVGVERELAELERARATLVPSVDDELLQLYEDLRRSKKGVGAAALVEGICQGCHQKLSPVYLQGLRRTAPPWRCEYCRRILIAS